MFAFYSLRLNFGNSISGTELRGCLFVPAAFTSSRSCVGDRTATENGDWVVQPHWLGLHSGGGQLALSRPALCTSCQGSGNRGWLVGWPTFLLPWGWPWQPVWQLHMEPPPGHTANGNGVPTAGSILGLKIPGRTLLMGDQLLLCMVGMKAAYNPDLPFPVMSIAFSNE